MSRFISEENFINAEKLAFSEDIPMKKALLRYAEKEGEIEIVDPCKAVKLVGHRRINSHKGDFGRLLLIVGSDRFPGAAAICAHAALRTGAGIVTIMSTERAAYSLAAHLPEATLCPLPADGDGFMLPRKTDEIAAQIRSASAIVMGCGVGVSDGIAEMLEILLSEANCPVILDADGINTAARRIECLRKAKALVLTPHVGELARLAQKDISAVNANRFTYARRVRVATGAAVCAKSSSTLVLGDRARVVAAGNTGLSRGGSGDMLAGVIGSLAAQGVKPEDAAVIGPAITGLACEMITKKASERGVLASDVISALPRLFKKFGV